MSKKPKPRVRFCWVCSKKLYGSIHFVEVVYKKDGLAKIVHKVCANKVNE